MQVDRLPPNDRDAEDAVLGGIMIDAASIHEVPDLRGEHFFSAGNGRVFDVMRQMMMDGVEPDAVSLPPRLTAAGVEYDEADLFGLMAVVPTSTRTKHYAESVMNMAKRRDMIRAAGDVANAAYDDSASLSDALQVASKALLDVSVDERTPDTISAKEGALEVLDEIQERYASGGAEVGLKTEYAAMDNLLRGLQDSGLYIIAGRTGMGKTALVTNIVEGVARGGKRVLFFSLEMSNEQVIKRMVAQGSDCTYNDIAEGKLTSDEWERVARATGEVSTLDIEFDDTPGITVSQIYTKSRRAMAVAPVDLIVVDYLQLMGSDGKRGNRTQEVGSFSRGLKGLAKALDVPIIALAQLSRNVESRASKRPNLTDLRDSGEIEQDADGVILMYRDDYYADMDDDEDAKDIIPGLTECNVAKNRFGNTGVAEIMFTGYSGKFSNIKGKGVYVLPGPSS